MDSTKQEEDHQTDDWVNMSEMEDCLNQITTSQQDDALRLISQTSGLNIDDFGLTNHNCHKWHIQHWRLDECSLIWSRKGTSSHGRFL